MQTLALIVACDPETLDYLHPQETKYHKVPAEQAQWIFTNDMVTLLLQSLKVVRWTDATQHKFSKCMVPSDSESLTRGNANDIPGFWNMTDNKSNHSLPSTKILLLRVRLTVGVKAVDDYTLQYTLNQPEPYWNSKLSYRILAFERRVWKIKGKDFGKATDPTSLLQWSFLAKRMAKSSYQFTRIG